MENKGDSTRVLIADDHQLFSDGLRTLLTTVSRSFTVIGQVYDGRDVIPVIHQLQPDLVLLDINLPHRNGIDIARQIRQEFAKVHVVIITMYSYQKLVEELKAVGVMGYLLKSASPSQLVACLEQVVAGKTYFDQPHQDPPPLINSYGPDKFIHQFNLTPRELEIIKLICSSLSTSQIADQLFLSEQTVKTHRKNIYFKLGVNKLSELIRFANEQNL
ncbi:response regulator transcription factor [Spirosoma sp. KNUC1025]|uniref:response regulator n=1 Tax=Spirosoma sp. KNUC1025 TaxID=2894082 RepID=UPI001E3FEFB1|nr:response regulator transcription factor [Spirosoma sp. KNUC1025]UFH57617.1 response regulator transcription factor [Spirosoma sp. KNUC1025]